MKKRGSNIPSIFGGRKGPNDAVVYEAVSKVVSLISHDIRTPLSVISGFLDSIRDDLPETKEYKEAVRASLDRILSVIDNLDEQTKFNEPLSIENTDIAILIKKVISKVNDSLDFSHRIIPEIPISIAANIDSDKVERVIYNVLMNSIQSIEKNNGTIIIRLKYTSEAAIIEIEDNGCGIPEELQDKIFTPGFTYGRKKGAGLGLSFSKFIIEQHNGSITYKNNKAGGSIFIINIPIEFKQSPDMMKYSEDIKKTIKSHYLITNLKDLNLSNKSVLVIDDDIELLDLWTKYLSSKTKEHKYLHSGEQLMQNQDILKNIDTAIVDYKFYNSRFTGSDIVKILSLEGIDEIYLCTGFYKEHKVRAEIADLPIKGIITKPLIFNH